MHKINHFTFRFLQRMLNRRNKLIINKMLMPGRTRRIDLLKEHPSDYTRRGTLELCAHEIIFRKVPGAVAEVGVYRGDFAGDINALFPDRLLFLFDTFEGFPADHINRDRATFGLGQPQDFSITSETIVMSKMTAEKRCVIRKGVFPETARDLQHEVFCLVSLDVDLFEPTYAGLTWFWPRLSPGGYILVHDYNYSGWPGVNEAVSKFSVETGVSFVPINDDCGSAVFAKPRSPSGESLSTGPGGG